MKLSTHKLTTLEKVEIRVLAFFFALSIVDIFPPTLLDINNISTRDISQFLKNLGSALIIFTGFLLINFQIIPNLLKKTNVLINIFCCTIILLVIYFIIPLMGGHIYHLLMIIGVYSIIKYSGSYFFNNIGKLGAHLPFITTGRIITFLLFLLLIFVLAGNAEKEVTAFLGITIFYGFILYGFSYNIWIPNARKTPKPLETYLNKIVFLLIISTVPMGILALFLTNNPNIPVLIVGVNFVVQLLITTPLSWWLFHKAYKEEAALLSLKKNLRQSKANLTFLRSQINPHFLFNILNTLYAAALQEGSVRTSEGIQKLGDMMRFMLHENFKEKVSLSQEIGYLENYIDLQKIKTDSNPQVKIRVKINYTPGNPLLISPMLLIPFVENAFKHGVSFNDFSPINIGLDCTEQVLNLTVLNHKHSNKRDYLKLENSGIGLTNVQQRLKLLYPGKHNLTISESQNEYSINLRLELI